MAFEPRGYVSFDTALSACGVLDHLVHCVRIATSGSDLCREVPGWGTVEWISLPDDLLFGDCPGTELDFPGLRVAQPEKALCDLLWLCESRGFAPPVESVRLDELDLELLGAYAARMGLDLGVLGDVDSDPDGPGSRARNGGDFPTDPVSEHGDAAGEDRDGAMARPRKRPST